MSSRSELDEKDRLEVDALSQMTSGGAVKFGSAFYNEFDSRINKARADNRQRKRERIRAFPGISDDVFVPSIRHINSRAEPWLCKSFFVLFCRDYYSIKMTGGVV